MAEEIKYSDDGSEEKKYREYDENENIVVEGVERDPNSFEQEEPEEEPESEPEPKLEEPEELEPEESEEEPQLETIAKKEEVSSKKETPKKLDTKNIVFIAIVSFLIVSIVVVVFILLSGGSKDNSKTINAPISNKANELPPIEKYKFELSHIDIQRINKRLESLTKYTLMGTTEEEYLKKEKEEQQKKDADEKKKLEEANNKVKQAELVNKITQEKEKLQKEKEKIAQVAQIVANSEEIVKNNEKKGIAAGGSSKFLKFIMVDTNKRTMLKTDLSKLKEVDERLYVCRNTNNNIEVFIGPLNTDDNAMQIIDFLKKENKISNILEIEMTGKEFKNRCPNDKLLFM